MDDFIKTIDSDDEEVKMEEEEEEEEEEVKKLGMMNHHFDWKLMSAGMNPVFSFNDDNAMYYGEPEPAAGGWNFLAPSRGDNRRVTSLRAKVDKVKKDKDIHISDSEEEEGEGEEVEEDQVEESSRPREEAVVIEEDDAEDEEGEDSAAAREYFEEETEEAKSAARDVPTFHSLHLSRPLLRAVTEMGFVSPTPIQARCIPKVLAGRDICAGAQTGSGKTAAFMLPTLERLLFRSKRIAATRVLVITPTRELATQCHQMTTKLMQYTDISACLVVGGLAIKQQEVDLRSKPDIIICTPGRMIDHVRNSQGVELDQVEVLILDEADRLLEMGFTDEVTELVKFCPIGRQTLLFSATMTDKVDELVKLSLNKPVRIRVNSADHVVDRLVQEFIRIRENREGDREAILLALVTRNFKKQTIIFFEEKVQCHRLAIVFGLAGLSCGELHGNMTQRQRLESLQQFKDGTVDYLLCTELAARGLDVKGCSTVINFFMPREMSRYIHRVGRTARAGRAGKAVTLVGERGRPLLREIVKNSSANIKSRTVPVEVIQKWRKRIEDLETAINEVYAAEREEKVLRVADMEATKAENILIHADEIASRPARTWFQSQKEKEMVKKATLEALHLRDPAAAASEATDSKKRKKEMSQVEEEDKRSHKLSRKKRRRLDALMALAEPEDEEKPRSKKPKPSEYKLSDGATKAIVKSQVLQKKSARNKKKEAMEYRQTTGADLFKQEALVERADKKKKKVLMKRKAGAFDSDMTGGSKKPKTENDKSAFKATDTKPKTKGHKSFKSKARFNRKK